MQKLLYPLIVLTCALSVPVVAIGVEACNPVIPTNAIAAAQAAAQMATTAINDAEAAWPAIKAFLPPDAQVSAQDAFDKAIFAANHAVLALNDAISAAIAANNANPDFSALLSQIGDAVAQVVAIVEEFHAKAPPTLATKMHTSSGVDVIADLRGAALKLKASKK